MAVTSLSLGFRRSIVHIEWYVMRPEPFRWGWSPGDRCRAHVPVAAKLVAHWRRVADGAGDALHGGRRLKGGGGGGK